ncbi:MAG: restriction endonuclease subunit S [Phycisphaerae bacterium]|jgi:restriction endonuclease S subunit
MAVCYTTYASKLDDDKVIDSRFYDPLKIKYLDKLKKNSTCSIQDEFNEITILSSNKENVSFPAILYDLPDSLGNLFNDGQRINSFSDIGSTKKTSIGGDFAISRLRHYLKEFGVLPANDHKYLLSTEYVVLRREKKTPPELLLPYFLLDETQYILEKSQRGSNHPRLANKDILNLPLPKLLIQQSGQIQILIKAAIEKYDLSKKLYPEAEQELLQRMCLDKVNTKHVLDYSITSKDVFGNERSDPEFYQPKFKKLIKHLKTVRSLELDSFCPMPNRGVQPSYDENGDILVINSRHLGTTEVDIQNAEKTTTSFYNKVNTGKARLRQFDVLMYSTGAYIGRTNTYLENQKGIASNHVTIIRPDKSVCNPIYLSLFLNSAAGLMQTDQRATGSTQREICPQNQVGKADLKWQEKLANKVIQAYEAKKEAKQKLQKAKELIETKIKKLLN